MPHWPADRYTVGTEGDLQFLIFPQSSGRLQLYTCTALEDAQRWRREPFDLAEFGSDGAGEHPTNAGGAHSRGT